jgi:hypothetical protein
MDFYVDIDHQGKGFGKVIANKRKPRKYMIKCWKMKKSYLIK